MPRYGLYPLRQHLARRYLHNTIIRRTHTRVLCAVKYFAEGSVSNDFGSAEAVARSLNAVDLAVCVYAQLKLTKPVAAVAYGFHDDGFRVVGFLIVIHGIGISI